jgi:hypothetical protein
MSALSGLGISLPLFEILQLFASFSQLTVGGGNMSEHVDGQVNNGDVQNVVHNTGS